MFSTGLSALWKRIRAIALISFILINLGSGLVAGAGAEDLGKEISCILCKVAQIVFLVTAGLAALVIISAGLKWLMSGDDPAARNSAKNTIVSAFVGIVIIFIAVYLVSWVIEDIDIPGLDKSDPAKWMEGCDDIC